MVQTGGSVVPPLPYLLALVVVGGLVGGLLVYRRPSITERVVLSLVPWMLVGAGLRTLPKVGAAPESLAPLFGTTAVYVTTFAVAGGIWTLADALADEATTTTALAGTGAVALLGVAGVALSSSPSPALWWPGVGLVVSLVVAAATWQVFVLVVPAGRETIPRLGPLLVFGHALDGVSTAIGVDVLGFGERTPTSRLILEAAASLPVSDSLGAGWAFVLVKLAAASLIAYLFVDYVREDPTWGNLLLGVAAAVGLGPGAHNLLLYAVAG